MNPVVYLAHPGMSIPLRRIPVYGYKQGTEWVVDLEVVCEVATTEARLSASVAGWLQLSTDGGSSYDPIPTGAQTGLQLGPLSVGRTAVKLKISISGASLRRRFVSLVWGVGT